MIAHYANDAVLAAAEQLSVLGEPRFEGNGTGLRATVGNASIWTTVDGIAISITSWLDGQPIGTIRCQSEDACSEGIAAAQRLISLAS